MFGDLISLDTPPPDIPARHHQTPLNRDQQGEQPDDVFEFFPNDCKPGKHQASPRASFTPPHCTSKNKWITTSDVRSLQLHESQKEAVMQREDAADDARANDQVTPPCKPPASATKLECPPTCPLTIPPSPLPSTPCLAPAAVNTDNHLPQQPLAAFDSAALPSNATGVPLLLHHDEPRSSSLEVLTQEQLCSSSSTEVVPAPGESAMEKELAEVRAKLAKVELSRDSIARDLGHQKGSVAKLEGTVSSLDKRLKAQLLESQNLKVWDTKNQNIELMAETQHIHGMASAAQAAAAEAQQQAVAAKESEARCATELITMRDAGVKLFKQIRAVVHALERNLHHFQRVPEVGLSIRQLHDWCAKHGPFWVEKGEEAATAAAGGAPQVCHGSASGAHALGAQAAQIAAPTPARSSVQAPTGAGDETMTISLGHVMALGAGSTRA
ncbi:hypothetical protein DUNSADRAFT_5989 [Dunaliella salina]|uniref:Uncharacterized protein n=1 Tax=Dunaliella salina TaxID=3046 RepID=A0ABQ7GP90_DUNSA|nr:hypothetical protein DUNSADRAFT_5989 [Dunaliella salina]|eukprot:KAF5836419.1 hypothetical protein DUNSADRAFT_5989 [Dunaliella salina]